MRRAAARAVLALDWALDEPLRLIGLAFFVATGSVLALALIPQAARYDIRVARHPESVTFVQEGGARSEFVEMSETTGTIPGRPIKAPGCVSPALLVPLVRDLALAVDAAEGDQ